MTSRYLIVLLLAGCGVYTPNEIREGTGEKISYESVKPPKETALCLARAIDENRADLATQVREHPLGRFEVRVENAAFGHAIFVVGDVLPADSGSSVTLWQKPYLLINIIDVMAKACP